MHKVSGVTVGQWLMVYGSGRMEDKQNFFLWSQMCQDWPRRNKTRNLPNSATYLKQATCGLRVQTENKQQNLVKTMRQVCSFWPKQNIV